MLRSFAPVAALLFVGLAGCAAPTGPATLAGYDDKPSAIGLTIVDARPSEAKQTEIVSYWATTCDYGIHRIGDEQTVPSRLVLLRHDLEDALGGRLAHATITVTKYDVLFDDGTQAKAHDNYRNNTAMGALASAILEPHDCSHAPGHFSATEVAPGITKPFVTEVEVSLNGKTYAVRTVYSPVQDILVSERSPALFPAMHQANAALAAALRQAPAP